MRRRRRRPWPSAARSWARCDRAQSATLPCSNSAVVASTIVDSPGPAALREERLFCDGVAIAGEWWPARRNGDEPREPRLRSRPDRPARLADADRHAGPGPRPRRVRRQRGGHGEGGRCARRRAAAACENPQIGADRPGADGGRRHRPVLREAGRGRGSGRWRHRRPPDHLGRPASGQDLPAHRPGGALAGPRRGGRGRGQCHECWARRRPPPGWCWTC